MNHENKISVIIPIYNVSEHIEKCVDSILGQNQDNNLEIILINDGSTDNSLDVCYRIKDKSKNVKVINQENKGTGFTRNVGLKASTGKYIYFCDPDDYLTGNLFKDVDLFMNQHIDLIIFGYWDEISDDNKIEKKFKRDLFLTKQDFQVKFIDLFQTKMLYTIWNKLYRREFLIENKILFPTTPMGQDTRFNLLVYSKIKDCQLVENSYYHYIIDRQESSTNKFRENRYNYKVEEIQMIENLLLEYNIYSKKFIDNLYLDVVYDFALHIAQSNLEKSYKKIVLKKFLIENNIPKNLKVKNITSFLLKYKLLNLFIIYKGGKIS